MSQPRERIVILGGGPGGYEAALVAAQLGAQVTVVDSEGLGGACVLTDCVPSKTLIATSTTMSVVHGAEDLGIRIGVPPAGGAPGGAVSGRASAARGSAPGAPMPGGLRSGAPMSGAPMSRAAGGRPGRGRAYVDAPRLYARIKALAQAQSADVALRLAAEGVEIINDRGALAGPDTVIAGGQRIPAGAVLIATGAMPRVLPGAEPDGERILNWRQLYDLPELPPELIVVGSGVTGAEFASAYQALGSQVTLVSSRERVLPHEDADAAVVLEDVFRRRGMTVLSRSRAAAVKRSRDGVMVTLEGGRTVRGSHCLLTVGMVPATRGLGLEEAGLTLDGQGFVEVDRVSRTTARGVYAAGDCTGVMMLASVAAMQGRIAMWHTLGEAVQPIRLDHVAATIFTDP